MSDRMPTAHDSLTPRERDIARLMVDGLTNAEIAERLVISPETVRWYVKEVYSKLGAHSRDEALALLAQLDTAAEPPAAETRHSLPAPVTSLVGRTGEIAALRTLLRDPTIRLVTLLGAPGIGKTRLSIETARRVASDFPDGVYFVPMAPLTDVALAPDAIVTGLGLGPGGASPAPERLKTFLRSRRALLVLDNCEHLLSIAALFGDLLAAAPGLKVLATSREPLHVYGEREFRVPPLDPVSEAVALFEARAQAVKPDFAVDAHTAVTVTAICKRLDGLPLAIELAAARMRMYTPHALLGRLSSRLNTLTGGAHDLPARQQTLRAAIAWSYDLLSPDEQRLFARFSVFEGGASPEAFADVCGFGLGLDPLDGLESLVSKSLIQQDAGADGEPRFTMVEALREFAAEQLAASGEEETVRQVHARHYLSLVRWIFHALRNADEQRGVLAFETEQANIRAAWLFAAAQPDDGLIELAARSLGRVFFALGSLPDGIALYEAALASRRAMDTRAEAELLTVWSWLYGGRWEQFDGDAEAAALRALELIDRLDIGDLRALALKTIASAHWDRGDLAAVKRTLEDIDALGRLYGLQAEIDHAEMNLALLAFENGDRAGAIQRLEAMLDDRRRRGVNSQIALLLTNLIAFTRSAGDWARASRLAKEQLPYARASGQPRYIAVSLLDSELQGFLEQDYAGARRAAEQALTYGERAGDLSILHFIHTALIRIMAVHGEMAEAKRHLAAALEYAETHRAASAAGVMCALAWLAVGSEEPERAVEAAAAALHLDGQHSPTDATFEALLAPVIAQLQVMLTPQAYAAAWAHGDALDAAAALALAREMAAG